MFKKLIVGIAMIAYSFAAKSLYTTNNIPVNYHSADNIAANVDVVAFGNNANLRRNRFQLADNAGNNNMNTQTNYASGDIKYLSNYMDQKNTQTAN